MASHRPLDRSGLCYVLGSWFVRLDWRLLAKDTAKKRICTTGASGSVWSRRLNGSVDRSGWLLALRHHYQHRCSGKFESLSQQLRSFLKTTSFGTWTKLSGLPKASSCKWNNNVGRLHSPFKKERRGWLESRYVKDGIASNCTNTKRNA